MKRLINLCVLGIIAISSQAQNVNIVQKSRTPYTGNSSNVWGYVDTTGKEYALMGAHTQLSIVDVTDPANPVKKFSVPGPSSSWREIRTYGKYAYVTTEGGGGLTIVNLSNLPDGVTSKQYTGDGAITGMLNSIHALHIDNDKLYLYGGSLFSGRAKMFSLADPWNPVFLGAVSGSYIHDGFAKNDTLYACNIYDGLLEIIDAKNPAAPQLINSQSTPLEFTHNSWMSTDGKVMYTTDERSGSYVAAYDITDLQNIKELDRYRHNNSGSIGHNTYVLNNPAVTGSSSDYLWTSYYTDGITLVDASRPDNLVEVGNFDSSPSFQGDGFNGAWGVYPYLPSGNILISDIQLGLYVVTPTYKKACYLEGVITDAITNQPIVNADVKVIGKASLNALTNNFGVYKNGTVDTGTYMVEISSHGYLTEYVQVVLQNGVVAPLNIGLDKRVNFVFNTILKDTAGQAIPNVNVLIENSEYKYELTTSNDGTLNIPTFYAGKYAMHIGKFGYQTLFIDSADYLTINDIPSITLEKGYYDDFYFDYSWTKVGTASTGLWVKAKPNKTSLNGVIANPEFDEANDFGNECYVTGNGVGNVTADDIDNGVVTLTSPSMDLSIYQNPFINYSRWFTNIASAGTPNDTFRVMINNGAQTAVLEEVIGNNPDKGTWVAKSHRVKDYISLSNNMKLIVRASDLAGSDHITEAAFDKFFVTDSLASGFDNKQNNIFANAYPNPSTGKVQVSYNLTSSKEGSIKVYDILGNVIYEKSLTETSGIVNVSIENKGMYFIRIESNNEQKVIKVVRQ